MRKLFLLILILPLIAFAPATAQTPAANTAEQQAPTAPPSPKPETVSPEAVVITLTGFCAQPASAGSACKTEITKAQFERLVNALNPEMPAATRRQLAMTYAQVMLLGRQAEERKLADSPTGKEVLQFARLQALSQVLVRTVQEDAANVPQAEIETYYRNHSGEFEEATMHRLFIPKVKPGAKPGETAPLADATVKATVAKAKAGAVAGQPFDKLQKDAYVALGIKDEPPSPGPATLTRDQMPSMHAAAFDLKQGEVSEPFDQPGAVYIYKVDSKQSIPLESAKPQIQSKLQEQRMQSEMQGLAGGVSPQLNDAYFGPEAPQGPPGGMPQQMPEGHP